MDTIPIALTSKEEEQHAPLMAPPLKSLVCCYHCLVLIVLSVPRASVLDVNKSSEAGIISSFKNHSYGSTLTSALTALLEVN